MGDAATGVIRLECTRIASSEEADCVKVELVTEMFLGDRKENLFKLGDLRLRCYGNTPAGGGECFLELPPEDLWVFPGNAASASDPSAGP